jgi:hypothetical protein
MARWIVWTLLLTLPSAGCVEEKDVPQRVNLEVAGSPTCLGDAMLAMGVAKRDTKISDLSATFGKVEFSAIPLTELDSEKMKLRALKCVRYLKVRPCRPLLSDLDWCHAPVG